jgi:hypothetical protein
MQITLHKTAAAREGLSYGSSLAKMPGRIVYHGAFELAVPDEIEISEADFEQGGAPR